MVQNSMFPCLNGFSTCVRLWCSSSGDTSKAKSAFFAELLWDIAIGFAQLAVVRLPIDYMEGNSSGY
jgi:hypothetical protein